MKQLEDFKEEIHKCSKCGLCQASCPIYKITGNDCSVSRGQFIMLRGVLNGELKLTKKISRYLDLCLKCGNCSKFCPSGIDVVDIIVSAKAKYYKIHFLEKLKVFFLKFIVFGLIPNIMRIFNCSKKSKIFDKKVLYFGGCGSRLKGDKGIVTLLNAIGIQVINPNFSCCGVPFFTRGDLKGFECSIKNYIKILKKYNITEVVTSCASCEKSLKDYIKWADSVEDRSFLEKVSVKNIYEYLRDNNVKLKLKNKQRITYHKPCNINNFDDIKWILNNTENLDYIEMKDFDKCCGLNGLLNLKEYKIMSKIFTSKRKNIIDSKANIVSTSCLGCEVGLKICSFGKFKVYDLIDFLAKNL